MRTKQIAAVQACAALGACIAVMLTGCAASTDAGSAEPVAQAKPSRLLNASADAITSADAAAQETVQSIDKAGCVHIQYCSDPWVGGVTCVIDSRSGRCSSWGNIEDECSDDAWAVCGESYDQICEDDDPSAPCDWY